MRIEGNRARYTHIFITAKTNASRSGRLRDGHSLFVCLSVYLALIWCQRNSFVASLKYHRPMRAPLMSSSPPRRMIGESPLTSRAAKMSAVSCRTSSFFKAVRARGVAAQRVASEAQLERPMSEGCGGKSRNIRKDIIIIYIYIYIIIYM